MSLIKQSVLEEMEDKYIELGRDGIYIPVFTSAGKILYKKIIGAINVKNLNGVDNCRLMLTNPSIFIAQKCFSPRYVDNYSRIIGGKEYLKMACIINAPTVTNKGYLKFDMENFEDLKKFKTYVWVDISDLFTKVSDSYSELETIVMRCSSEKFIDNRSKINKIFH